MSGKHLIAADCPYNGSVNVYFVGEQPGDSADPRCAVVEDEYIAWLEDRGDDPCEDDRLWRMNRLIDRHMPDVDDRSVHVHYREP